MRKPFWNCAGIFCVGRQSCREVFCNKASVLFCPPVLVCPMKSWNDYFASTQVYLCFFSVFVYFHWCTVYTVYCAALYIETISGHCLFPCINSLICTLWLTKGWRLKDRGLTQQKFWQQEHESGQDVILINHLLFILILIIFHLKY